jgi:hypothetical protein
MLIVPSYQSVCSSAMYANCEYIDSSEKSYTRAINTSAYQAVWNFPAVLLVERLNRGPPGEVSGGVDAPSVLGVGSVTGAYLLEIRGVLSSLSACAFGVGVWDLVSEGTPGHTSPEG